MPVCMTTERRRHPFLRFGWAEVCTTRSYIRLGYPGNVKVEAPGLFHASCSFLTCTQTNVNMAGFFTAKIFTSGPSVHALHAFPEGGPGPGNVRVQKTG